MNYKQQLLQEAKERIIARFTPNFVKWLQRVVYKEKPPNGIVAYNVGLFESQNGYSAYLIGSKKYNPRDDDWAANEAWTPKERYFSIPKGIFKDWKDVQSGVVGALKMFLNSDAGKESFLGKATAVTVGFDDGDLERVK